MRRHVFVTGAGSGIGEAIAARFAHDGEAVALCARSPLRVGQVAKSLAEEGGSVLSVAGDIGNREDAARMIAEAEAKFGSVDVLVNNAGIFPSGPLAATPDSTWDEVFDTNVRGIFLATRAVLPGMIARKKGWIVNVSSVDGKTPGHENAAYSASKAAVVSLTQATAREAAPHGVLVNGVAPGWVATPKVTAGTRWKEVISRIPLGRLAELREIADVVAFLCSGAARYIVGETINVNGGIFMD